MMERFVVPGFALDPNKLCISAGALHVHGRNAVAARCSRTSFCPALQPVQHALVAAPPTNHAVPLQAAPPSLTTQFTRCAMRATACSSRRPTTPHSTTTCRCGRGNGAAACGAANSAALLCHAVPPPPACIARRACQLQAKCCALAPHRTPLLVPLPTTGQVLRAPGAFLPERGGGGGRPDHPAAAGCGG